MRIITIIFFFSFLILGCENTNSIKDLFGDLNLMTLEPVPTSEIYFDTTITDPYRQIEDLKDSSILNWFAEQGQYAQKVLSNISGRDQLIELMKKYDRCKSYHIENIQVTKNDHYFYLKRKSDEEVFNLCYRKSLLEKEEILFKPNDLEMDGSSTFVIYDYSPDWEGDKIAIAIASRGSDQMQIVIYDVSTKSILPQIIENNFNASNQVACWLPNNKGFLYLSYNKDTSQNNNTLMDMKTRYYKMGEEAVNTVDVFSKAVCPDFDIKSEDFPTVLFDHEDSKYLIGLIAGPTAFNDAYYIKIDDLYQGKLQWKPLYKKEDKVIKGYFVHDEFIFISAKKASNHTISRTNLHRLDFKDPELLIPQKTDEVIQDFKITSSGLYYVTSKNGVEAKLYLYHKNKDENIRLSGKFGRIYIENRAQNKPDLWVSVTGWISDMQRMKYDISSHGFIKEQLVPEADYPGFDDFEIEEISIRSHDGEMVPLSIISKKGMKKEGGNPTLLYGYGAYGIPWRPYFLPDWLTWVENGGVLCFSHIRGGGEKGNSWHLDGKNHHKPNSWKDFIACAEYLIDHKYTSNKKLVIYGGSAGGIVIGRSMTQRPDLYAAAISEVGMLNAIRFSSMPSGLNHAKEFGYLSDPAHCKDLIEMDAYLHLEEEVKYPPFLAVVGMNDLRVSPWQSGKYVARLQQNHWGENITLMMVDFDEGHYFNSSKTKSMEKLASIFAFAFWQTDHPKYQYKKH